MKSRTTIVGVDPSLRNTAVCVGVSPSEYKIFCVSTGHTSDLVRDRISRYQHMVAEFQSGLASRRIEAAFIEGYSFGSNDSRARYGAEYGGLLRECLCEMTGSIYEVAPTRLKKFVTGTGKGRKHGVIQHLVKNYGVMFDTDDEFDAYGLFLLGLAVVGEEAPRNKQQREVLASMGIDK